MANIIEATKRQIEILALIQDRSLKFSVFDLEDKFSVSKATVERDLQQLRAWGISIHSVRGKYRLVKPLPVSKYVDLLSMYVSCSSSYGTFMKSLTLVCQHLKSQALDTFIKINKAIEERKVLKFAVNNLETKKTEERMLYPYDLTLRNDGWLVVGYSPEREDFRHFLIENMSNIQVLEKIFLRDRNFDIAAYYNPVWGRYHDRKAYNVKIWFDPSVAHIVESRQWHTDQKIKKQKDGSVIFEAKVTGLYEIMNWVLPWGRLAKVLRPKELIDMVKNLANEISSIY